MTIKILEYPAKEVRPAGAIRCDVAWKLFDPDNMGDFRMESMKNMIRFTQWLWADLSNRSGYLRKDHGKVVWIIAPELTESARSYLVRICSFWDTDIQVYRGIAGIRETENPGEKMWIPPVQNIMAGGKHDASQLALNENDSGSRCSYLSPLTGFSHAFMRVYDIEPGHTYSRHHSHTAREEHYIVISGSGRARIADREIPINPGDVISKPTGPDLSTQILAAHDSPVRILDIEIWSDPSRNDKDVVVYPDHREICLFGGGWHNTLPLDSLMDAGDTMQHYETGYVRKADGTWSLAVIPGTKAREEARIQ